VDAKYLDPEIERLTELYEKDPTSRIFAPLADAYRKSKLYDEAIDIVRKGLEIHPDYVSAHLVLARCYYEKDMLQLARGALENVLQFDQQNLIALRLLGDIFARLGEEGEALKRYKQVLEIDPANLELQSIVERMAPSGSQDTVSPPETAARRDDISAPIEPHPMRPTLVGQGQGVSELVETPEVSEIVDQELPLEEEKPPELRLPEEPRKAEERVGKGFATLTLAEIYEEQGFIEKALGVYRELLESHPEDEHIKTKVEQLSAKIKPGPGEPIQTTEESFMGLLNVKGTDEEKSPEEKKEKKVDFGAFKQWLEGLSKNEKAE